MLWDRMTHILGVTNTSNAQSTWLNVNWVTNVLREKRIKYIHISLKYIVELSSIVGAITIGCFKLRMLKIF